MEELVKVYIYALIDPSEISSTLYIGYTIDPAGRLSDHITGATTDEICKNSYKNCWIRSLLFRDVKPAMIILEEKTILNSSEEWKEDERWYIAYFKSIGAKLCNSTDGGDGTLGHKHSDETKQKMRKIKLGTKQPEEVVIKRMRQDVIENMDKIKELYSQEYSLDDLGQLYDTNHSTISYHLNRAGIEIRDKTETTDKAREKIRAANLGKTLTEETKQKISTANLGQTRTEETCNNISTTRKERIASGEITMSTNRATGADAGTYRDDVEDDVLVALYNDNNSLRAIGKIVGMEHHSIKARLIKAGATIKKASNKDTSKFIFPLDKAKKLFCQGNSLNKIARLLNISDSKVVKRHLEADGVSMAKVGKKKLIKDRDKIIKLYNAGANVAELARAFKVSDTTMKTYLEKEKKQK